MNDLNQLILNFDYDQNFKDQDFYVSKSNEFAFKLLNSWPKWEKNFVNLIGEKFSGKTHLVNIFLHKFKGIKIEASEINNDFLKKIKIFENIIITTTIIGTLRIIPTTPQRVPHKVSDRITTSGLMLRLSPITRGSITLPTIT